MAISKRLRYEIFRRDNHTCRYCGRSAPEVVLHVDHVIPQALGGAEKDPSNLVTSCSECNGGKSASSPDQAVVADVSESAAKWKAAIAQAADESRTNDSGRDSLYEAVIQAWPSFHRKKLPGDFAETVDQFVDAGLPHEAIIEMAQLAGAKPSIYNRWAYFCGCCWTKIRQLQDRALEIVGDHPEGSSTERSITTVWTEWTEEDITQTVKSSEEFADSYVSDDLIDGAHCEHVDSGQKDCGDAICRVQRAESLSWMAFWSAKNWDKHKEVMDAADELEMLH